MASKNTIIGTGAALAGLGGLAAAAVTVNSQDTAPAASTAAQPVQTQTVVVRTVEHRVKRVKAKHRRRVNHAAPAPTPITPAAPVVQAAAPIQVAATPAPVSNPAPIRTRTSGGGSARGGDDGAEHEQEHDDSGERADD